MDRPTFFQAAHLSDQESIDQFVVRQNELDMLVAEIRRDDMSGSIQHYVIIGQRGSGKSTLLRRIQAAIAQEKELAQRLVAVNLSEEQAGVYRLHDLWDRVGEDLREKGYTIDDVNWTRFEDNRVALARASYAAVQKGLHQQGTKLVLLLDNIDRIFENLDKPEAHLFRELLINHKDVRIIGASTRLSEHHWKYDKPFYEFFHLIHLEPLDAEAMRELLRAWADRFNLPVVRAFVAKDDGRLDALRILGDGMPRTMLHLLELISQRPDENSYEYLRHIVDKATAIYQERLGTMSPHQQKVLLELSFFWEAASAKQLGEAARMDTKLISAALKKLTEARYVEALPGKGKNHLYRLRERFFNLWLIMTQGGPKQKRRVKYLTIFLEIWYGREGLPQLLAEYRDRLKRGELTAGQAALMTQALARSSYVSAEDRDDLVQHTRPIVAERPEYVYHLPNMSNEVCGKMHGLLKAGRYQEAIEEAKELEQDTVDKVIFLAWAYAGLGDLTSCAEYLDQALKLNDGPHSYNNIGFVRHFIKDYSAAEALYLRAINMGQVDALNNLALLYQETENPEQAKKFYMLAIDQGHLDALFNLANLYYDSGEAEQAEKFYLRAIEKGHAKALFNLALLYQEGGKSEEAERFYLRSIDKGDVNALNNLALHYQRTGKPEKAEEFYGLAINAGNVSALNNLGLLYHQTGRLEQAEQYYLRAIAKDDMNALFNFANLYRETDRLELAEQFYIRAIAQGDAGAMNNLANLYRDKGELEEAEQFFLRAVDRGDVNALYNLARWRYIEAKDPLNSLELMRRKAKLDKELDSSDRCLLSLINIWSGRPEDAETLHSLMSVMLKESEDFNIAYCVEQFLIHFQTEQLWACFMSDEIGQELKERVQPFYFATAHLLGKSGSDAVRVMPTELATTVEAILQNIESERLRYYPKAK